MALPALKSEGAQALADAYPAPSGEASWAEAARNEAERRLFELGAPVRRDEYWKYTDPGDLTRQPAPAAAVVPEEEPAAFGGIERVKLVFLDGVFAAEQSDDPALAGVEIRPLREALRADIHWAREIFGALEKRGQNPVARPLAALNTARAVEGVAIRVSARAERPVHVIYRQGSDGSDALIRHVVKLEAGADFTLLESGHAGARSNIVTEVELADEASFHHVRSQLGEDERRTATAIFARLGAEASFKSFTLTLGGRLTRNESIIEFRGDDAHARVAGAAAGRDAFHHDDTVFVTHDAQCCESRQVFKKVLDGGATGIFQGKILVKPDAQKTDGYQISQGLLLDEASQFLTKPELEIYADDVACSHGSTCGPVDEDALFYLTSRGVPKAEAEALLVLAFLQEAIEEIEDARLAEDVRGRLARWMERH
jgi:Fe-S cluster assembly protein SufD